MMTSGLCETGSRAYHVGMRLTRLNHIELLRYAGLFTFACTGIPALADLVNPPDPELALSRAQYIGWAVSYAAFGLSYWLLTNDIGGRRYPVGRWSLLAVISVATIANSYYSRSALGGILLLVMSGVLPWIMPWSWALAWLVGEFLLLVPVFVIGIEGYGWFDALLQSVLYFGFSSFTVITTYVARDQAEAREEQRRLNAELRATRALLAESSRMNERVRISRELHDLLGHHLTALSLNLEVASHLVQGPPQDHVRQAQSVAKLLLSDVREVVSQLRQDEEIDLNVALRMLVEGIPEPRVHLDVPEGFSSDDPRRAHVLLRCAQETITNTIRHARARNLWLRFERAADHSLRLYARDDGQGADDLVSGNGLNGMRERLAQVGGELRIEAARGRGFALEAIIPAHGAQGQPLARGGGQGSETTGAPVDGAVPGAVRSG